MPETLIRLINFLEQPETDPAKIREKLGIVRNQLRVILKQIEILNHED